MSKRIPPDFTVAPMKPEMAAFRFGQQGDDMAPGAIASNGLEVEITDGGGGPYIVIKAQRWALNAEEIDQFAATLRWCLAQCTGVK